MQNLHSIQCILNDSTVLINLKNGLATGFWVSKSIVLTCAHVVKDAYANQGVVSVTWKNNVINFKVAQFLDDVDLTLLEIQDDVMNPSCVMLDDNFCVGDKLYGFGYSVNVKNGESFTPEVEGISNNPYLIKLKNAQIVPGFSGAPLLNLRTGGVCGVVRTTRDRGNDLGGRAVPTSIVLSSFRNLKDIQEDARKSDTVWLNALTKEQKIFLKIVRHDSSFKSRVADLYMLLSYTIKYDCMFSGRKVDLQIERSIGDFKICRIIKIVPDELSMSELDEFIITQNFAKQELGSIQGTIISGVTFQENLKNIANLNGISLVNINDLENKLINGRAYCTNLNNEIINNLRYNLSYYIEPQVAENLHGIGEASSSILQKWLHDPDLNQLTILGDVGTGKTFLTRKLAYDLAQKYLDDPINNPLPIHIDLRNADRQFTIQGLILSSLQNSGLSDVTYEIFSHSLFLGKIVLILDGFDEMASSVTPQITNRNFAELARVVTGNAKVLLTCRTHYFRSRSEEEEIVLGSSGSDYESEIAKELYWDLISRKGFSIAYLRAFSLYQIEEYIGRVKGSSSKKIIEKIRSIYNLEELCQRPMLLEMIVKSIDKIESNNISAATLYQVFTDAWVHRDKWRDVLSSKEKLDFLTGLSRSLYIEDKTTIHYSELQNYVKSSLNKRISDTKKIIEFDNEIRTASFLTRDDKGNYGFAHKSYREFFLATYIADQLQKKNIECLKCQKFTIEVCNFLKELISFDSVSVFLSEILTNNYIEKVSENALIIYYCLFKFKIIKKTANFEFSVSLPDRTMLNDANLCQIDLEGIFAHNINLSGATVEESIFRRVSLSNCNLERTNFSNSDLSNSTFSNSSFSNAKLSYSNLNNTIFINSDLSDVTLVGSDVANMSCISTNLSRIKYLNYSFPDNYTTHKGNYNFFSYIKLLFPESQSELFFLENSLDFYSIIKSIIEIQCVKYGITTEKDDILSLIYEKIYLNRDEYANLDRHMLRDYVNKIVKYQIYKFLSKRKDFATNVKDIDVESICSRDDYVKDIEDHDFFSEILSIIETELSEKMVRIVKYRFIDDLTVDEIAVKENVPKGDISSTLYRALKRIRNIEKIKKLGSLY